MGRTIAQLHAPASLERPTQDCDRENRRDHTKRTILEDHRLFYCLHLCTGPFGQDPYHFRKYSFKGRRSLRQPLLTCHHKAQGQGQRFLLCEYEWGEFVPWPQAVAPIAAMLSFDRYSQIGKGLHIIANGSDIDLKPPSKLCTSQLSMGLQKF